MDSTVILILWIIIAAGWEFATQKAHHVIALMMSTVRLLIDVQVTCLLRQLQPHPQALVHLEIVGIAIIVEHVLIVAMYVSVMTLCTTGPRSNVAQSIMEANYSMKTTAAFLDPLIIIALGLVNVREMEWVAYVLSASIVCPLRDVNTGMSLSMELMTLCLVVVALPSCLSYLETGKNRILNLLLMTHR